MGIVAYRAWRTYIDNVFLVIFERLVAENAVAFVTTITKRISRGTFRGVVCSVVACDQQGRLVGAMGAVCPGATRYFAGVRIVTIAAIDDRGGCHAGLETGDVVILARTLDRME